MRLADFILKNLETILQAWENFARSIETPMAKMDAQGLRNYAEHILRAVASQMHTEQNIQQQIEKSEGHERSPSDESKAKVHAIGRLQAGFSMDQMVSEYRALRSSVLREWLAHEEFREYQVQDMIRFNEGIDQALVESIATYGQAVETTRKTVLAILGHDLRSPLGAALMGADLLQRSDRLTAREKHVAQQISAGVHRANMMVDDLLDLARCNLGAGIPIRPEPTDLAVVCKGIIDEIDTAHPNAQIEFKEPGALPGNYDPARMAQVFANLVNNAVRHGSAQHPIVATLAADGANAVFTVCNQGKPIPADTIPYLFSPERRYSRYTSKDTSSSAGLGLGLYIANEIVAAHDGVIEVESTTERGTVFRVVLPSNRADQGNHSL